MKTFLIKGGKAISTIKREGLARGGKRVVKAFVALFGRVKSGDILFVTGGVGDSALYRAHHQAEELSLHGLRCSVTVQDNPFLTRYVDKFSIFIFHRVLFTPTVAKMIEKIKRAGKEIIFETDDLVFDSKYLEFMDSYKHMNYFEKKLYENGVGGEILIDPYVKTCTTTTTFLSEKLEKKGKKVFVSKNKLSNQDLEVAERILTEQKKEETSVIRIGYFSGTKSHDKDFATVEDALLDILEKYADVKLFLAGPLQVSEKFEKFSKRIERSRFVPREKHFENISRVDINIAPLEIGNPFCEAKSELKFIEAGIVGVPTIAAATQTFREAIEDGVDGFVAKNTEEWKEKLEKLILNGDLRRQMGEIARERVLEKYTNKNSRNEEYYNYLKSKI